MANDPHNPARSDETWHPRRLQEQEETVEKEGGKLVLDIYVQDVPSIPVVYGPHVYRIVEPGHLLSLYETTHSSKFCTAVRAAKKLIAQGISPVGRPELISG